MKNFRLKLILKVVILAAILCAGFFMFFQYGSYLFIVLMTILAIISITNLIKHVDLTNRDLARFLSSIKYSDFSQSFGYHKQGSSFNELSASINLVMDEFRKTRTEKEEQYRFLQTVLRHINIGLLSYDQSGKLEFINKAARSMLGFAHSRSIKNINELPVEIRTKFFDLKPGERIPLKIYTETEIIQLIIYATEFKMRDQLYKLVSLQNIQIELEEKELEAWQQLIRVLTHEIMNSVTPISSLASTVNVLLNTEDSTTTLDAAKTDDIKNALKTIEKRSKGLIDFVDNYRNLTKIPKPDFEIVLIKPLFDRIHKLLKNELEKNEIDFRIDIKPGSLEITADTAMIEQVLINLIFNAVHALNSCKNRCIQLSAELNNRGKIIIKISDNGPGIPEEIQEKIFIPFFSTKKDGSGIGLSLARQIMRAHGGNIRLKSEPYKNTEFSIIF